MKKETLIVDSMVSANELKQAELMVKVLWSKEARKRLNSNIIII